MKAIYHLNESEFDLNVFEAIKTAFKNRLLKISVETQTMDTVSKENFEAKIETAEQADFEYHLSADDLKSMDSRTS